MAASASSSSSTAQRATAGARGPWKPERRRRRAMVTKLSGESIELVLEPGCRVSELKGQIAAQWHVPLPCQELATNGTLLHDDDLLFADIPREQDVIDVTLILTHEKMAQLIVGKHPKARDEAMQALATFAMRDHRSARRLVKLILDKMTEKAFRQLEGFIPRGDDVLIQEMTVSEAKARVADLPGCLGFTFRGQPTGDPVKIFFKRKAFVKGVDWTSFIFDRHDGRQELLIRELNNLERTFDFLMLSSQEDARATETLREQLRESAMTDQAFVSAAQIMLKVWPACVPPVLEAILARLQSGRGLVGEAQLLKALSKHSARHDEAAIAAYCTSLSSTMGDAVVVAAKALLQHAPPGHARAVDALVACVTRLGCCVQSPILRALCHVAPRGHRGAIAALEACLTARPPASVAARRHVEIQVQVEQGLKLLRAEPEQQQAPAAGGGRNSAPQPCAWPTGSSGSQAWCTRDEEGPQLRLPSEALRGGFAHGNAGPHPGSWAQPGSPGSWAQPPGNWAQSPGGQAQPQGGWARPGGPAPPPSGWAQPQRGAAAPWPQPQHHWHGCAAAPPPEQCPWRGGASHAWPAGGPPAG